MEGTRIDTLHEEIFERFRELIDAHIGNDLPKGYDREGITDGFNIGENVRIEEEGFPFSLEFYHEILHHFSTDRIESAHRLIEKYEFWIMQDCLSKTDALEHAFRVGMESIFSRMSESDSFQDGILSLLKFHPSEIIESPIELEELISREVLVEIGILWHESDTFTHGDFIDRFAQNFHFSLGHFHNSEDALHGSCLSCTIWSEKSEYFALLDREINIV